MRKGKLFKCLIAALLTAVLLASHALPALAADNEGSSTWGVNMQRTRRIDSLDNMYQNYVTYNSTAQYCQLDNNLQSFSTPTDYTDSNGNTVVLAYGSEGENGYLYGLQESNKTISSLWGGSVKFATQSAYQAASAAGPTTDQGYTAMGVGNNLYAWPNQNVPSQTDATSLPDNVWFNIDGNPPGNSDSTTYQVDMSPAITNPVTWTGYDANLNSVTWSAPAAVVGSWDGGVISAPVSEPVNVTTPVYEKYCTTQDASGSGTANITSSPCYISTGFAGIGTNGDGAVIFGISDIINPWLVAMDPGNGNYKTFGGGPYNSQVLAAGISSPPVWYNNYLYVVDNAGNLYCFDSNANLIKAQYFYAPTASDISSIAAANGDYIYAMEDNHTKLAVFDEAGGSVTPLTQEGSWAPGNGDTMYSPSLVDNGLFANIYLCGDMGNLYSIAFGGNLPNIISSNGSGFVSDDGLFYGTEFTGTGLPPYSAVIADVGADHLLAAWTNNAGQNNVGGIEYWTPAGLTVQAFFTENTSTLSPVTYVLPNATVYLVATPNPLSGIQGVAYQDADNPATWTPYAPAQNGTMFAGPTNGQGYPSYWYIGPLTAPSQPGTYSMEVTATNESGQTAQATAALTVQNTVQTPTGGQAYGSYLQVISYGLPSSYGANGTFDLNCDPRPCPWLSGSLNDPNYTETKLADTIQCELDIPASAIESKQTCSVAGAQLVDIEWGEYEASNNNQGYSLIDGMEWPQLTYPQGSLGPAPDYETVMVSPQPVSNMSVLTSGGIGDKKAQFNFTENWDGYYAHGGHYQITTDPATGKETENLITPDTGWSVSYTAWISAIYKYQPPQQPDGSTPPPEYFPVPLQYTATVQLEVIGTDVYSIPTTGGSELYEWY